MSPKRGDRAAPPPVGDEYDLRFATNEAAAGWENLARHAPGNLRRAFERMRAGPRATDNPERRHRLKGALGTGTFKGQELPRRHYEVTGGGRLWYLVDEEAKLVWVTFAGTGHPKATD